MADELNFTISEADVVPVPVDATLSIQGQAADAKAVGDALADKADRSELATAITVNDQAADAQGSILVTAEQIPMDESGESTAAAEIAALKERTGEDIPINADTGAESIEMALESAVARLAPAGTVDRVAALEGTVYGRTATDETDLDSITVNGMYWLNLSNCANSPVSSGYAVLEVVGGVSSPKLQRVTIRRTSAVAMPRVYERIYVNGQWDAWASHNGEIQTKTLTGTTNTSGNISAGLSRLSNIILSAIMPGYICIPFSVTSNNNLYFKVLDASMNSVPSTSVTIAVTYLYMGEGAFS